MGNIAQNKILYLQYSNPAHCPPLEHSSRILAGMKWSVLFFGLRELNGDPVALPACPGIVVRELLAQPAGWRQKLHYLWFFLRALAFTLVWRPRWIYASGPLSCPIAVTLSWLPGLRVLYHEHDAPLPGKSFPWVVLAARRSMAKRAEVCVLPNQERARKFKADFQPQGRVFCAWNCPEVAEVSAERALSPDGPLRLYYHGTLVPERLSPSFIRAIGAMPQRVHLLVAGFDALGAPNYRQVIQEEARRAGIQENVEIAGLVPERAGLRKLMSRCDVGLSLVPNSCEDPNLRSLCGASIKTFEYLAAGMALLVSHQPEWVETFVRPGYGLSCNPEDPESIRRALEWFLEHREETRRMGERGRQAVLSEWNYERQFSPIARALEGVRRG